MQLGMVFRLFNNTGVFYKKFLKLPEKFLKMHRKAPSIDFFFVKRSISLLLVTCSLYKGASTQILFFVKTALILFSHDFLCHNRDVCGKNKTQFISIESKIKITQARHISQLLHQPLFAINFLNIFRPALVMIVDTLILKT